MKKIGHYTVRGQASENDSESEGGIKINVFDGDYTTGYRVTKFEVWGATYSSSSTPDVLGKLATEQGLNTSAVNFFNAADQREIAWSGASGGLDNTQRQMESIVDRENLIIEELYVYVRGNNDTEPVNWYIEFDKFELPPYRGSLAMVQNRSQG